MKSPFWYCGVSIAPVRSEPKDSSEMVTQLFFGETLELIETDRQWRKIKSYADQYEGWIDEKLIHPLTEKEFKRWMTNQSIVYDMTMPLTTKDGDITLIRGSFINDDVEIKEQFKIGNESYSFSEITKAIPDDIKTIAMSYINAPYLWGGKTTFGIDCSGFTQVVYRFLTISLPRDAYQQAEDGAEVELDDSKVGDLAFFDNAQGKITHVGIILEDGKVIHAHGKVRIDRLTNEGIYNADREEYTHKLCLIKRYL